MLCCRALKTWSEPQLSNVRNDYNHVTWIGPRLWFLTPNTQQRWTVGLVWPNILFGLTLKQIHSNVACIARHRIRPIHVPVGLTAETVSTSTSTYADWGREAVICYLLNVSDLVCVTDDDWHLLTQLDDNTNNSATTTLTSHKSQWNPSCGMRRCELASAFHGNHAFKLKMKPQGKPSYAYTAVTILEFWRYNRIKQY